MTLKPSQTRMALWAAALACGAAFLAGLAAPLIRSCTAPDQRQPATLAELRDHLAGKGLELELRPVWGTITPEAFLARPGAPNDGPPAPGVVLVVLTGSEREAAQLANLPHAPPGRQAAWR